MGQSPTSDSAKREIRDEAMDLGLSMATLFSDIPQSAAFLDDERLLRWSIRSSERQIRFSWCLQGSGSLQNMNAGPGSASIPNLVHLEASRSGLHHAASIVNYISPT